MNRRQFTLFGTAGLSAAVLAACSNNTSTPAKPQVAASTPATLAASASAPAAGAAPADVPAGSYRALTKPVASNVGMGKAEVIEFFGYWCPHCNHFEPEFEAWVKSNPAGIIVRRVPVAFRPEMAPLQRTYFALESLNLLDSMHGKVFDAIHKEKKELFTDEAVLAWAATQPELGDKFAKAYKDAGMQAKLTQADELAKAFEIDGVPSFGVAGRYYVDGTLAQNNMTNALNTVTKLAQNAARGG